MKIQMMMMMMIIMMIKKLALSVGGEQQATHYRVTRRDPALSDHIHLHFLTCEHFLKVIVATCTHSPTYIQFKFLACTHFQTIKSYTYTFLFLSCTYFLT